MEIINNDINTNYSGVVRGKEDIRDYMSNPSYKEVQVQTHRWQMVKVDNNLLIQGYIENTQIEFKLLGYTSGSDPAYFTMPPEVTPSTTGAWTTVEVSSHVDSDADGVILFIDSINLRDRDYGVREVGSSFSTTDRELGVYGNTMYLVGINGSDQFEAYIQDSDVKVYLVGQTKGSVVYYTDDTAIADPSRGPWQELDADDHGIPAEANGLIFQVLNASTNADLEIGLRHGDSTDDWNKEVRARALLQAAVGIGDDNVWDQYLQSTSIDVFIAAYTR